MSKDRYPYPSDEFDAVDPSARPAGVHSATPTVWSRIWPYLLVLVLAPALGFGAVKGLSWYQDRQNATVNPPTSQSATTPQDEPSDVTPTEETPTEDPAVTETTPPPEPTETTPEAPPVDHAATVIVYNAARVNGLAGKAADELEAAGWTTVEAKDYAGSNRTPPSAVYYHDDEQQTTAAAVAADLGIAVVEKNQDEATAGIIAAVLRSDFTIG